MAKKPITEFYKQSNRGVMGVRGSCKLCNFVTKKEYRNTNQNKIKNSKKASYDQNKEHHLAQKREYRQANKGKINALVAARKTVIKQRTPCWLTKTHKDRIENEYKLAALLTKITGEAWHVDHIIPLQGKLVSGLHVPSNLKAIRGVENIRKKNRFEVNYAE
jgi:hypothetical protein